MSTTPPIFSSLLPEDTAIVERKITDAQGELFPEEAALLAKAVEKRKLEFTAGRTCLRNALGSLGVPPGPILKGEMRAPKIPEGITGSITHSGEWCAGVALKQGDVTAIGIDIEKHTPLKEDLFRLILLPEEQAQLKKLPENGIHWGKLFFSAKEAYYKAYFQIVGEYLDFLQAQFEIDAAKETIRAKLLIDPDPKIAKFNTEYFHGKYSVASNYIYTAFTI